MVAFPWYLLATGIILMIIGFIMAAMIRSSGMSHTFIHDRMSDDDIAEKLQGDRRMLLPNILIFLGLLCIVVSIGWRLLRWFVK
jgi:hypothetical protein